MAYGYRLWMEGHSASYVRSKLDNKRSVGSLIVDVIRKAGMQLAAGPLVYREPSRDVGKGPGVTAVAILIESSVHIHTYPEQDFYFFELFSCKSFDHTTIVNAVCAFMGMSDCEVEYVPVGDEFPVEDRSANTLNRIRMLKEASED